MTEISRANLRNQLGGLGKKRRKRSLSRISKRYSVPFWAIIAAVFFFAAGRFIRKSNQLLYMTGKLHNESCSCWSLDTDDTDCCRRFVFRGHKFGSILLLDLFEEFLTDDLDQWINFEPFFQFEDHELPRKIDYRHVAVTRNWFDAIVSGYLYHKSGHECWINVEGYEDDHEYFPEWESDLSFHEENQIPFPDPKNRSLCKYLVEESEEDGMKVLMDFALSFWYRGVISYHDKVLERFQQNNEQHSLFICYEDLIDPFQQEVLFYQILEWLFPGRDMKNVTMPVEMKESLVKQQERRAVYSGEHSTTNDPKLRARLRALVKRYDRELFNNTVASSNAVFGCGGKK